ncbi:GNAT family N-acetyltransferase [Variovorax sp. J22R133]|uniref:GNAT family N-acetyltransferase n=1 Tax=Variovorax brevis TaxID=3053503 RepID=UPI002576604A|nr:GNAT family N-acetyltransferase [Variovorax sp. J22R133]MDM0117336.1 GNAT family N-acetyltransferase [Variovorax sp. J22R133]
MPTLAFRPLARSDFALLGLWLRQPHVARWWADDPSPAALERDYGACIDGTEPAAVFIATADNAPLGFIQRYRLAAYPHYVSELASVIEIPEYASSIDYFIGPPGQLHRGLGTAMLGAFASATWRADPGTSCILVPTHAHNAASNRALERAGFRAVATGELEPDHPADTREHVIYRLDAPKASGSQ